MIRHSVTIHRGCYGGCSFCTISAHQGKQIVSRSKESIIRELRQITRMEDFRGYVSDLGGPSANMYGTGGRDKTKCLKCKRPTCLTPKVCPNLSTDLTTLTELYKAADKVPGVKKTCIGSGIRYDILRAGCGLLIKNVPHIAFAGHLYYLCSIHKKPQLWQVAET